MSIPAITIEAHSEYLEDQSIPEQSRYAFVYRVQITNNRPTATTLLRRHWVITDANNRSQEVEGEGVVGEQPVIHPGQTYSYISGAVIDTPAGTMEGRYLMASDEGEEFHAAIPVFGLIRPQVLH